MIKDGLCMKSHAFLSHYLAGVMAGVEPLEEWGQVKASASDSMCIDEIQLLEKIVSSGTPMDTATLAGSADESKDWTIESERVRLFETAAGGIIAPPYGSWWLDGRLMGPSTGEVASLYQDFGLAPGFGPADHISSELEFLHVLIQQQLEFSRADPGAESDVASTESAFLDGFVFPWIDRFLDATKSATTLPFWVATVSLIRCLLIQERKRIAKKHEN